MEVDGEASTHADDNSRPINPDHLGIYWTGAPPESIARGQDYGRLAELKAKGLPIDISKMEKLVLAKARCHCVTLKIVAKGDEPGRNTDTARRRLHGHASIYPHKPMVPCHVTQTYTIQAAIALVDKACASEGDRHQRWRAHLGSGCDPSRARGAWADGYR